MEYDNKTRNLIRRMRGFQVKAKKNLCSSTSCNKFTAIQKSEIKMLKSSNKKEILLLKVTPEII
jgi:hypothetical protein